MGLPEDGFDRKHCCCDCSKRELALTERISLIDAALRVIEIEGGSDDDRALRQIANALLKRRFNDELLPKPDFGGVLK